MGVMLLARQSGEQGPSDAIPGDTAQGRGLVLVLGSMTNRVRKQRGAEIPKWWLQRGSEVWGLEENTCPVLLESSFGLILQRSWL